MSSCWIFWTKWMWSDPNLSMLSISNSISPNHMHSKLSNVFSASLSAEDTETNIKSAFNANSFTWNPEKWERPPDNPGVRGTWNKPQYAAWWPRVPQMRIARATCVITQCHPCTYKYTPHSSHYLFFHSRTNPSATASPRQRRWRSASLPQPLRRRLHADRGHRLLRRRRRCPPSPS